MHLYGHPRRRKLRRPQAVRAAARSWAERLEGRVLLSTAAPAAPYLPPGQDIAATTSLLSAPTTGQPLDVAMAYLRSHAAALGLSATDLSSPLVTDQYTDADTSETHIYLRERVNGIEVAGGDLSISLTRDNQVIAAGGHFVPNAAAALLGHTSSTHLSLNAVQALQAAAPGLGLQLNAAPTVQASSNLAGPALAGPFLSTTLIAADASVDPIPAKMVYIPTASGLRLGWDMTLRTPDGAHWYDTRIDGVTGALLGTVDWADPLASTDSSSPSQASADPATQATQASADLTGPNETYDVYPLPEQSPDDGPRVILTNPADPAFSPFGWHDTNGKAGAESTLTVGNNVSAYIDAADTNVTGFQPDGGASLTYDAPIDFTQDPRTYAAASVEQLFYVTNTLHDIHASYGFTEAAGNFQTTNYSNTGRGFDALQAQAQDGGSVDNSNMFTPPDGQSPVMQIYLFDKTNPRRDADLDNTIVVHEYGHGVSTRLTGGPSNSDSLDALQSAGMGEGWSDWWALMLTQKPTDTQSGGYGIANYVFGSSVNGGAEGGGIRQYPYSFDLATDPLTFNDFNPNNSVEVHSTGTIWTSTLWDLNWELIDKYGFSPTIAHGYNANVPGENGGNNLALKLIMDALKIQPSNPSFLDARNAILSADQALNGGKDLFQIWTAFARRGLGFSATDISPGAFVINTAYDLPPQFQNPIVIAQAPVGTQTSPPQSIDLTFNTQMDATSFSVAADVASFTGPGGTDLKSQITGFSWLDGNTTLHITFAPVTSTGQYTLTAGPQILSAATLAPMNQNLNGTPGEATDLYSAHFSYTAAPLAVSSISPAAGSIVALPMTSVDVHFNQPIDAASVNPFLLAPSRGFVSDATIIDSSTVRYTLSNLNAEGPFTLNFPAGIVKDLSGNDSIAFPASYSIDIVSTPFPAPLFAQAPAAPLVWDRTTTGTIGYSNDADGFTLNLDAGQVLSAVVTASGGGLRPTVDLLDTNGLIISSGAAIAAGGRAIAEAAAVPVAGTYTIRVSGAAGTTGDYSVRAILNAAVQNLDASFIPLGNGAAHGAVFGQLPAASTFLLSDNFSSGTLGPAWTTFSSDSTNGEIFINSTDGHNYLLMDHNDSEGATNNLNEAVLAVDLSGQTSATLTFQQTSFGDEQDFLPTDFSGHFNGDGVSISDDNFHWHRVWDGVTSNIQGVYGTVAVDLAAAAAAAGMNLGSNFRIKFQQFDNYPIPIDGRGFGNIAISVAPPASDYYSVSLKAGQTISANVSGQDISGGQRLDLLDASGKVLAAGIDGGLDSSDLTFNGVPAPVDGAYYVRVMGQSGGHYLLSVTTNADLELGNNDSSPSPILAAAVGGTRTVLGHLKVGAASDQFSVLLNAGEVLALSTSTPGDGPNEPDNLPDPMLRLLDSNGLQLATDNNSAPDGRNARLTYTAGSAGVYVVDVSFVAASATGGDYVLTVQGGSTPAAAFSAQITNPHGGSVIGAPPPLIDVSLTQPVLFSSVTPGALTIDGIAASSVVLIDGQTLGFAFSSPLPDGPHTISIAAGAFTDLQGDLVAEATLAFTTQSVPPRVISSSIAQGDVLAPATLTYTATFNQVMTTQGLDASIIRLFGGLSGLSYSPSTFGFDATGKIFKATYVGLPEDNYVLTLNAGAGGFTDAAGNALDGEPSWPLPATGSGNGTAGGDFFVGFSMDVGTAAFPTPLNQQAPAGSLVYTGFNSGAINSANDTDSFTIALAAGQTVSLAATPTSANWSPRLTLIGPGGNVLATASTTQLGQAVLESIPVNVSGTYTILLASASGTGSYSIEIALNAAFKSQSPPASQSLLTANAQNLDSNFTSLDPIRGAMRGAVLGTIDAQDPTSDVYSLTLAAGQSLSVGCTTDFFGGITVRLVDATGAMLAIGAGHNFGSAAAISDYVISQSGIYYLAVDASPGADYNLVLLKDADFESASNQSQATPQDISTLGVVLGSVGDLFDTADYYSVQALPGNVLTFRTNTPGGPPGQFNNTLNPQLDLFGPNGKLVLSDNRSAPDRRNAELHYTIPAGGAGMYTLKVSANGGPGEYVLLMDGITTAPPPGAPTLLAASDSGVSSNDRITNFNNATPATALQVTIPGTSAGATVQLFANGILIGTALANGSTLTMTTDGHTRLSDGAYQMVARETMSDNTTVVSLPALPLRIMATAPSAPGAPAMDHSTAGGISTTITKNPAPLLDIPTPLFWRMYRDGVLVSSALAQGSTFQSASLAPGVYHFTMQAVDSAGNVSPVGGLLTLTIDQTPPIGASVTAPPVTAPHGKSYGFLVTYTDNTAIDATTLGNDNIIVNGPAGYAQPATLMSFTISGNSASAFYRVAAPSAGWTGVYSGTYFINLVGGKVRDVAGNAAVANTLGQFGVVLSITAPQAPQLTADSDRGIANDDNLTNLNNATPDTALQFFVADTQPGGLVSLYADGVLVGTTVASDVTAIVTTNGHVALANGQHVFTARITAPGQPQTADSPPQTITIFNQTLAAPPAPILNAHDDSGVSDSDGITNVNTPTFQVSALPYFRLEANGVVIGQPFVLGTAYAIPVIADGSYDIRAIAEDDAGNESAPSALTHIVIETQPPPMLQAGAPDPAFGDNGLVTLPAAGADAISAVAAQPDGRIIAAGLAINPANGATMIKVVRFNTDGSQDLTFGNHGAIYTGLSANSVMNFRTMAIQPDGSILLAGEGGLQFAVTRLTPDGALDTSFGHVLVNVPSGGDDMLTSLCVQADGTIVAGGQISGQMGIVDLRPTGILLGGVKVFTVPGVSSSIVTSMALDTSGRLILAGTAGSGFSTNFVLARLDPFNIALNVLDTTFGTAGFVITPFGTTASATTVRLQADGKILVAGNVVGGQSNIGLARFSANGALDATFGTQGLVVSPVPSNITVSDMLVQADGRILVAGTTTGGPPSGFIARFTSNGILDPLFGTGGYRFYAPKFGTQTINQLLPLANGNVLAAGSAMTVDAVDNDFALTCIVTSGPSITIDPASDSGVNNTDGITNVANPVFDVLGLAGNYYRVYLDGTLISDPYASASTYPIPLGQGIVTFTLVDPAGNESTPSTPTPFVLDNVPPIVESVAGSRLLSNATSNPYQAQIFFFDDDGLDLSSLGNAAVQLTGPNGFSEFGTLASITVSSIHRATVTYNFSPPGGAWDGTNDGLYSLNLVAGKIGDIAGNTNDAAPIFAFQVAVTNSTLVAPILAPGFDSGKSNADGIINFNNSSPAKAPQFIVGGNFPGTLVTLYANGVPIGSATATSFFVTVTADGQTTLPDGVNLITVRQTPPGGVQSGASAPLSLTIDSTPPRINVLGTTGNVTTASNATFGINLFFSDPNGFNSTAVGVGNLVVTGPDGKTYAPVLTKATIINGQNSTFYQFSPPGGAFDGSNNGTYTYTMVPDQIIDNEGNALGAVSIATFQVNVTLSTPQSPALSPDTHSAPNAGDNYTNFNNSSTSEAPKFIVTGAVVGTTVQIYYNGTTLIGSAPATGFTTTVTCDGVTTIPNGLISFTARLKLPDGTLSFASPSTQVNILRTTPAAQAVDLSFSDNGVSSSDGITNAKTILFNRLFSTAWQGFVNGVAVTPVLRNTVSQAAVGPLADGTYVFGEVAIDIAGNSSAIGAIRTITIDTIQPIASVTSSDVTSPSDPGTITLVLTDNSPLTVPTVTNSSLLVSGPTSDFANLSLDSSQLSADGHTLTVSFHITPPTAGWSAADNGTYLISPNNSLIDVAGNRVLPLNPIPFHVALTNLPVLAAPQLNASTDSGTSTTDGITNFNNASPQKALKLLISTPFPGATVTFFDNGAPLNATQVPGTNFYLTDGQTALTDGANSIIVHQSLAGYTATDSPPLHITIDTQTPATIPPALGASDTGISGSDNITRLNRPDTPFTLTTSENGTYQVLLDGVQRNVLSASGPSVLPFDLSGLLAPVTQSGIGANNTPTVADFNGDGVPDLLADGNVVYLGSGNGTFTQKSVVLSTFASYRVVDLNGDSIPDLLANTQSAFVSLLGLGDGTFKSVSTLPAPQQVNDFQLADLNNDGKIDLVYSMPGGMARALGSGDGSFGAVQNITNTAYGPLLVSDFNSDGKPDILAAVDQFTSPSLFAGLGGGVFAAESKINVPQGPRFLVLGDINGDSRPDVAMAALTNIEVELSNGDGTFTLAPTLSTPSSINSLNGVALADFNSDGVLDVAVMLSNLNQIEIFRGNGNGTFQGGRFYSTTHNSNGLVVSDLNSDGIPDVVTADGHAEILMSAGKLSDGPHAVTILATDIAGNQSTSTLNFTVDTQPPTVQMTPVVAADGSIDHYTLVFSEPVYGLSLSALSLTVNGGANLLTAGQTLVTSDQITWTLGNLSPITSAAGSYRLSISTGVTDAAGNAVIPPIQLAAVVAPKPAAVVGRYVFYNHSAFDGENAAANSADDKAIATDKHALLPGQKAGLANYTNYTNGINGIMIDVANLPRNVTLIAGDFTFRVGNSAAPSTWKTAPAPKAITIRRGAGAGGSDRIEILFADRAILNRWLQVTVLATAHTGLSAADIFYFGNLVGESGNSKTAAMVSSADQTAARAGATSHAGIANLLDFNRDGVVNSADVTASRSNQNTSLQLFTAPLPPPPPVAKSSAAKPALLSGQAVLPALSLALRPSN